MQSFKRVLHSLLAVIWLAAALGWSAAPAQLTQAAPLLTAPPRPASVGVAPALPPGGCTVAPEILQGNATSQLIPDAASGSLPGVITSTVHISTTAVSIWDVNIQTFITHTRSSDLSIFLISPHGTLVTISSGNGGSAANVFNGTTWDDQAGLTPAYGPVTLAVFTTNVVKSNLMPEEPLSAFNGENPNGDWQLVIKDTQVGFTGGFGGWYLDITALTQAPAPTYVNTASPISPQTIPDGGVITASLTLPAFVIPLTGLTLTTGISHTRPGDLVIELITPSGLTLTVSNRNGGSSANAFNGTVWYDGAGQQNPPGAVTDSFFLSGLVSPLAPQEAYSEFNGHDGSGHWTLRIQDQVTNGHGGQLLSASLLAVEATCQPDLQYENNVLPLYPRLGQSTRFAADVENVGATANHVFVTTTVSGGFAFQAAGDYGWTCSGPILNLPDPVVHCTRPSMGPASGFTLNITLTAPLSPAASPITITAGSDQPDLFPSNNTDHPLLLAFAHSANGNPWDVADMATIPVSYEQDSGAIEDGGQDAFNGFGQLKLRVLSLGDTLEAADVIHGLGLTYSAGGNWHTTITQHLGGISVSRDIFAPPGADWARYVDTFTNNNFTDKHLVVGWGGGIGHTSELTPSASSTHDALFTSADTWVALAGNDAVGLPSFTPPVGLAFRSAGDTTYQGPFVFDGAAFTSTVWPAPNNNNVGQVFRFTLNSGATLRTAYFVYRGLTEGAAGPADCGFYGGCLTPATGSQQALAAGAAAALQAAPPFCDLSPATRLSLVNWPGIVTDCLYLPVIAK